ncbi:hypothetical protein H0H93_000142 [Arthromyces matolae]|nr:hypothetical protein H0H93_000142 [Arthromyces matolae]
MSAEKAAQVEKGDYIPLPATEPQPQPQSKKKFFRFVAYALILLIVIKAALLNFKPNFLQTFGLHSRPPHPHLPHFPHRRLSGAERDKLFLSIPNSESALAASRALAAQPHLAGSSQDFEDAKTLLKLFQTEFGINLPESDPIFPAGTPESRNATLHLTSPFTHKPSAWIDVYYPVLNTPLDRSLQILGQDGSSIWDANLVEDGDPLDEDAAKYKDSVPAWHGLSKDGVAEGQLVYANYGSKADYDQLVAAGANLTGKIVITRYGHVFRGLKIKGAEELGAVGVLIYSDPRDDGYVTTENGFAPYPAGPARNPTSVQRGSVQYLSSYPGDPTTPGYPAYEDAQREEGTNIPKIPSLPISWENGARLLKEIGALYSKDESGKTTLSGESSISKIKLVNHVDTKVTPIWNTMASIPGHIKDEVVIVGCHRDAWVLGAADPTSGTVALHEVIRAFGALLRTGWKPLRTVVFASWDAEEYGLVGSTEWGEDFAEWISKHAVAYLNTDVSSSGSRWEVKASPSLAHLIRQIALEIPHPTIENKTLWDARHDEGPFKPASDFTIDGEHLESYKTAKQKRHASKTGVSPLGSGSDFTVFLQRLGVASSDEGFGGVTPTDAVYHYHSIYDSQRFQELYADPGFHHHVAVSKHLGLLALRLADSLVVPMNTTQYALELDEYLDEVSLLQSSLQSSQESVDLSRLAKAIQKVQAASRALDKEKFDAEKDFKHVLRKLQRRLPHRHHRCRKPRRFVRRIKNWIKRIFGVEPHNYERIPIHEEHGNGDQSDWTRFLAIYGQDVIALSQSPEGFRKPDHPKPKHSKDHPDHPKHLKDHPDHPEHHRPDHRKPKHPKDRPDHPDHPKHPKGHPEHPDHHKHPKDHPDYPEHRRPDHPKPKHPKDHPDHPEHRRPDHPKPKHPKDHPDHPDHPKHPKDHPDHPEHRRPDHPKPKHPKDHPDHPDHPKHPKDHPDHPEHRRPDHPKPKHPKDHPDHPDHPKHPKDHPDHPEHRRPDHPKPKHPKDHPDHPDHPKHPKDHPDHPEHRRPDHPKPKHPKDHPDHPDHPKHPKDHPDHPEHRRPDHPKPKHPKDHPDHPFPNKPHDRPEHPSPDHPKNRPDRPDHHPKHPKHPEDHPDYPFPEGPHDRPGHPRPDHPESEPHKDHHDHPVSAGHPLPPKHLPKEIKKLVKAAKRIVKINKKIVAFERGFISEEGIKDREWYKHLGVAPGKWLGYGATTFPALTEALEIDRNVTLAAYETERLAVLLERLAETIKP